RHPKREATAPATGIAPIDPSPRHSSTSPSAASSSPARAFAKGTIGAPDASTSSGTRNAARVAHASLPTAPPDTGPVIPTFATDERRNSDDPPPAMPEKENGHSGERIDAIGKYPRAQPRRVWRPPDPTKRPAPPRRQAPD